MSKSQGFDLSQKEMGECYGQQKGCKEEVKDELRNVVLIQGVDVLT